jgi:hypothetical protein
LRNKNDIGLYFTEYFQALFTSSNPTFDEEFSSLFFSPVIALNENDLICVNPDEREIKLVISQLGLTKAPGPNCFTGLFYKTYWPIIRLSVINFVQAFFIHGFLLKEFNHTHIALIPKVDNPSRVTQFRPIRLAYFTYKIISKILANRLKPLLQKIISPNKSAFLPGRSIQDNSILAHEIFHSMKKKKGNGALMALKLNMEKAFDRMEWGFISKIFSCLGFNLKWIRMIEQFISTITFSILLDSSPYGKFSPNREIETMRSSLPLSLLA